LGNKGWLLSQLHVDKNKVCAELKQNKTKQKTKPTRPK
jgi:hypothetical protein